MNKERLIALAVSKPAIAAYSSIVSASAGAAGAYFLTKRQMNKTIDKIVDQETAEAKKFYEEYFSRMHKGPGYSTPQEAADTLGVEVEGEEVKASTSEESALLTDAVTAMTNYAGVSAKQVDGDGTVKEQKFKHIKTKKKPKDTERVNPVVEEHHNIFKDGVPYVEDDPDYLAYRAEMDDEEFEADRQMAIEAGTEPYVITFEEFMQAEPGYQQPSLSYFAQDDILLDDREQVIEDVNKIVGPESLYRFGYRSKNNDIVYVRNPVIELDFEITRSNGSYASEVAGFKHSADRRPMRKFRLGDDE